jgi:hypothetical protein
MLIKVNEPPAQRGAEPSGWDEQSVNAGGVAKDDRRPAEGTT